MVVRTPVRFGSVRFGSVRFGSVQFGSVRFVSFRFAEVFELLRRRGTNKDNEKIAIGILSFFFFFIILFKFEDSTPRKIVR